MGNPNFLTMGRKGAKGRTALEAHLKGKTLSRRRAAYAKCYECMGGYGDAPTDCMMPRCPLYLYMPYRRTNEKFSDPAYQESGKQAKGRKELIAHMQGTALRLYQAVLAKCYDCKGGYVDGKCRCKIPACPLHPWMPYKDIVCPYEKEETEES